jgi:hypothetical protein
MSSAYAISGSPRRLGVSPSANERLPLAYGRPRRMGAEERLGDCLAASRVTIRVLMARRDANLLTEVQRDALDANVPVADALRKLVALGGEVGSKELREWASLELRGYRNSEVELPEYRVPPAVIEVDAIRGNYHISGQQISPRWLPAFAQEHIGEEVRLNHSVGEIEAMWQQAKAESGSIKLTVPHVQDLVAMMNQESNQPFQHFVSLYWVLSAPALSGVLDRIRTILVELVAEMRAEMPSPDETPSREVADRAVNVVVHGQNARVNVTTATATGSGAHEVKALGAFVDSSRVEAAWPALRAELADLGVPKEELETLHTALASDGDPVDGELGIATRGWIGQLSTKVASGALALGEAASTEVVSHTILRALGLM